MNYPNQKDPVKTAIEIAVNLTLIAIIVVWCFNIIKPFISIIIWAAVIAVSMWKPFLKLQSMMGGNKKLAAKRLGIHRSTLYAKMKRYGLDGDAATSDDERSEERQSASDSPTLVSSR